MKNKDQVESVQSVAAVENQEVLILDESGYDIEWFLCRCPVKTWVE